MKKLTAIAGLCAILALSACDKQPTADTATTAEATATTAGTDATVVTPTATETTVVTDTGTATTATGDQVSVSEKGVSANVKDGDTTVKADVDKDPTLTVTKK